MPKRRSGRLWLLFIFSVALTMGAEAQDGITSPSEGASVRGKVSIVGSVTGFGGEVQGAYQFEGKEYVGRNARVEPYSNCGQCHSAHELEVRAGERATCRGEFEELTDIRMGGTGFGEDGDTTEGIAGEIETGAFAHSPKCVIEILYGSIEHVGGGVSGMTRR